MLKRDAEAFLAKVADDEPIFILRAQDKAAPIVVHYWVVIVRLLGAAQPKRNEAAECMIAMGKWQADTGKAKIPD